MRRRGLWTLGAALAVIAAAGVITAVLFSGKGGDGGLSQVLFGSPDWADWDGTALFIGDSITDYCDLSLYYPGLNAVNQGISGDTTGGMLDRLEQSVFAYEPDLVVLHGGINDLLTGYKADDVVGNMEEIIERVQERLPDAEIVLQSLYPVGDGGRYYTRHIRELNVRLEALAEQHGCLYADVYSALCAADGSLDSRYSDDGLHPNEAGYEQAAPVIAQEIKKVTGKGLLG